MRRPVEPLFLARQSYRRRRVTDAAKVLPFVGVILWFLPLLWVPSARTAAGGIYIFTVWALLICAMALLAGRLSRYTPRPDDLGEDAAPRTADRP